MKLMRYVVMAIWSLTLGWEGKDSLASRSPCHVISAGAEMDTLTGSVQNVGQTTIGAASNGLINIHAGAIPCLVPAPCADSVSPDLDEDCDVDLEDYAAFVSCASGPAGPVAPGCKDRDFDGDDYVDLSDFSVLQRCYRGSDHPPDPSCSDVPRNR